MTEYAKLVISVDSRQVTAATNEINKIPGAAGKAEKATDGLGAAFKNLAAPLAAFLSARAIINASDQYGQMAARIRMATSSTAEYLKVQERLLSTANATYRPLQEAQEVYIRTADAIRSLGYNTDDVLDITDSFSFLLVTNAASADKAASAIDAYSKAIQTGKLESDGWQSILAAMPTVVDDLAAATGRSNAEIRKLGIEGKLNLQALNEALRQSAEKNEELAASMETSVADAATALSNSFQVFVGKVNETSHASGILTENIGELAEILQDPKTIQAAQELAGGVVAALNTIISGAKETVEVVRWAAESMSAAMNGAASDDIVRLQDQLETYQEMLDNPLKRLRIGGKGQAIAYFSEDEIRQNIQIIKNQIDAFWKEQENRKPNLPAPIPEPKAEPAKVEAQAQEVEKVSKARKAQITDAERLIKRQGEYVAQLEREAILLGKSASDVRRYELLEQGLTGAMRERAEAALDIIDANEKQEAYKQLVSDLRTEEERLTDQLKERLKVIESMPDLPEGERRKQTGRAIDGAFRDAPKFEGIDASIGGPAGEMIKIDEAQKELEDWYSAQMEMLANNRQERADLNAEWDTKELDLKRQHEEAMANIERNRQSVQLSAAESTFGSLAEMAKAYAGESSGIYKALFAVEKTIAIARAAIAIQEGIALAAANPFPLNLAAMASVAAATAGLVGNIASIGLEGMAHDGIDSVPREGTWLLDKGERVVDSRTNQDLKSFLRGSQPANQSNTNNININVSGMRDSRELRQASAKIARDASRAVAGAERYT
ncbi:tape measure domain protein [compost metagenome]